MSTQPKTYRHIKRALNSLFVTHSGKWLDQPTEQPAAGHAIVCDLRMTLKLPLTRLNGGVHMQAR